MSITMDEGIKRWRARRKSALVLEIIQGKKRVVGLLEMNKNTVQRIFQLKGWQVRKRAVGHRPRIRALPSVAPDERWETDLCRVRDDRVQSPRTARSRTGWPSA